MPLIHYVLLKFSPDVFTDELFAETQNTFSQLQKKLPGVYSVDIRHNCVERPGNYDIIIRMELESKEMLKVYLDHPLHVDYAGRHKQHMISKASIDVHLA